MTDSELAHGGDGETATAPDPRREAVIDARLADLAARFGDRWDEGQRAQVRANLARRFDLGERLRRPALGNADEPGIVFVPFRAEG